MTPNTEPGHEPGEITSLTVLGARLMWVAVGPFALLFLAATIISRGTGWLTLLDALFGAVVALMILGRWVEQRSGAATTVTGQRATMRHCEHYVAILTLVAGAAWVAANVLGNHVLK
jgi:divalent metal cation (Fe/Co/Zn/Cd) transporter